MAEIIKFTRTKKKKKETSLEKNEIILQAVENPVGALRGLLKGSLYYFIQYFWDEYSQDTFKSNWHIPYICGILEDIAKRVANEEPLDMDTTINVPPGSTKTAIASIFFPLWCWTNWFWMRFVTASYTAPLSLESAEYSRDVMRSEKFKAIFPELQIKQDKDLKSNFRIEKIETFNVGRPNRVVKGGGRYSTSVGGTVTGFHGHILIVDDPIDPQRTLSEAEITKANHWLDNTLPFRKIEKEITPTIMIMQRLHQDDPTGHQLDAAKESGREIRHICIPGEINSKGVKETVKPQSLIKHYKDGLFDPIRLNKVSLDRYLALGNYTYSGQVLQDPRPLGGGMIKVNKFRFIDSLPHPSEIEAIVRYWDKAASKDKNSPRTSGTKMLKYKNGRYCIMDIRKGRWSVGEREENIRVTAEGDGTKVKVFVEQEPGSGGKESADSTIINMAGFHIEADRPVGDKALRADPFSVQVENGNVDILRGPWVSEFITECEYFPNSKYKDQVDSTSGAFSKLAFLRRVKIGNRNR